ncbi:hypothetical protein A4A49_08845 [Nicotiana attenuata]|uniref:Uncharacterized protein n=1 Tax=Nicotiana attenuata TaxID=49451 RepID=A0A1J6J0P0_NICAT|nr:hypothetical protein A4A49_08845 [Nicotiana attenuata]
MQGCLEDGKNYHIDSCVPISFIEEGFCAISDDQFELLEVDEQEFERAKAGVPSLEETLSNLSDFLLNGNDDQYNLLRSLLPTESSSNIALASFELLPDEVEFSHEAMFQAAGGSIVEGNQ